jgi:hypothetical protein
VFIVHNQVFTTKIVKCQLRNRSNYFHLNFDASNALNDPIEELTIVTTQLKDDETKRITWWLEAPAYYFDFAKKGQNFTLTIYETDDLHNDLIEPKLLFSISGNEKEIIEPFSIALKNFSSLKYEKFHWYDNIEE